RKSETELVFTALVSGNLGILVPDEKAGEEDVCRVFSMHIHVSLYTPLAFGVPENGAHLAVVVHGRDVANAKYSDWVRNQYDISIPAKSQVSKLGIVDWSLVNGSMTKEMPYALKERKSETELAFTALVSGNLGILVPDEKAGEEDVCRVFSMHIHVSLYTPLAFGVPENGAHLAVVGHGRDVTNAKYSDWVRMRRPLEKLRHPSAELLLSNDGDHILEGCLTNFFVLSLKDNMEEDGESAENMQKNKYGYSLELQTAPIVVVSFQE
nr:D-aminoacid aminotransferase-like PLP-dependent enzymes superfamily protein [Tanacetum cinerariifolium]